VDYYAAGLSWKQPAVTAASTANITSLSGLQTIDTITLAAGDTVLVKNQTTAADNGIYVVASGAWSRSAGADVWTEYPWRNYFCD
jgi:phage-related tail fiber protein